MALDPVDMDLVLLEAGIQPLPQVHIEDRRLIGLFPATLFPVDEPSLGHGLGDVLRIGIKLNDAGVIEGFKCRNGTHQLHAVVGGLRLAARQLLFDAVPAQDGTPAAGSGLPEQAPSV